ncbi:MAG: transglycosylase SLT domain-containing protein [Flavobacteriales bacterium]|nr:transglycosylase SLT domain-containing protein [Flavobacteriales bacterium]
MEGLRKILLISVGFVFGSITLFAENEVEKSDSASSVEVVPTQSEGQSIQETQRYFSTEITLFDDNKIPVDSSLFFSHVSTLEFQIPLDFNSEVKRYIDYFGTSWQTKLKEMIHLSEYYFPIYETVFDKYNLPLELKYVSVIESALNPYAVSRSGAVGLWQFMPYTGKIYDLQIDRYQDERRDVEKSTEAAAGYFSDMSKRFDDWLVVIASYNCGPGNINKAINRAGGKTGFWEIYPYLPSQTQHYIPSFIAVAYLMNFYEHYGIFPAWVEQPQSDVLKVSCTPDYNLQAISDLIGISIEDIRKLNPALKTDNIPANVANMELALPTDKALVFWEKEGEILTLSETYKPQLSEVEYIVKRGDSLPAIANKNGCSIDEIKEWNDLKSNTIHPGNKLKLYL